jgi:hypothetical protein
MKKITKKEIKEFLKDIKKTHNNMGWKINKAGAYTKDGKIILYLSYVGQSLDANIHNRTYNNRIDFTDMVIDYVYNNEYELKTITDNIYDDIITMTNEE